MFAKVLLLIEQRDTVLVQDNLDTESSYFLFFFYFFSMWFYLEMSQDLAILPQILVKTYFAIYLYER